MNRVRSGMKEVIYEKEKKSRIKDRTLWYTIIDRERGDVAPSSTTDIE